MKPSLRKFWLAKRRAITQERRIEASDGLLKSIAPYLEGSGLVLSYASIESELDTSSVNKHLQLQKRLVLPRVTGSSLRLYRVDNCDEQLIPNSWSIQEPSPDLCTEVTLNQISIALIPAVAFDLNNHRIGYGKGHYDRLLANPHATFPKIGIGFFEQFSETPFPAEEHDVVLTRILLV